MGDEAVTPHRGRKRGEADHHEPASVNSLGEYDVDSQDYSGRDLGEDGGTGGYAEWRVEETYVAALSAKRVLIDLLQFLVQHRDASEKEGSILMNMLMGNALRRIVKADYLMEDQAERVKAEMESCSDKIGAVHRWVDHHARFEAAFAKLNDLITELPKPTH